MERAISNRDVVRAEKADFFVSMAGSHFQKNSVSSTADTASDATLLLFHFHERLADPNRSVDSAAMSRFTPGSCVLQGTKLPHVIPKVSLLTGCACPSAGPTSSFNWNSGSYRALASAPLACRCWVAQTKILCRVQLPLHAYDPFGSWLWLMAVTSSMDIPQTYSK